MAESVTVGFQYSNVVDLKNALDQSIENMYDYIVVPLAHPRNERDLTGLTLDRNVPLTRSDLVLTAQQWSTNVVGILSPWFNFDSYVERVQLNSRFAFKQEMAWATHLSLPAVLLPTPTWNCNNYSSCVLSTLLNICGSSSSSSCSLLWVEVPLVSTRQMMLLSQTSAEEEEEEEEEENDDNTTTTTATSTTTTSTTTTTTTTTTTNTTTNNVSIDSWECWNQMRTLCNFHQNLQVALKITENIPDAAIVDRWTSEPVRALILPVQIFLTNKKGYPVLSKKHQELVKTFFKCDVQVIIRGNSKQGSMSSYQQYVTWLWRQLPPLTDIQRYERPYWDYLQSPLQPLMDNLESQTYETFEKDPVKYQKYEEAITEALRRDPFLAGKSEIVFMVLGAGRGPLVSAAMRAAQSTKRQLKLYALEKNQNAVNTLFNLRDNDPEWKNVTVIGTDIRNWTGVKADIVVSELLGSFGDNELSPECLYGAQNLLKDGGISIPCSYTSYLAPLSSVKLYNEVNSFNSSKNFETAYVVKFHAARLLSSPQPYFTFNHPSKNTNCTRYANHSFKVTTSALLHGFAGYFDATLYGDVHISIYPPTCTPEMFSWFPLFFPLHTPLYLSANSEVDVHMWRLTDGKKVWYEWTTSKPHATPLHNPNGRSWWIGL